MSMNSQGALGREGHANPVPNIYVHIISEIVQAFPADGLPRTDLRLLLLMTRKVRLGILISPVGKLPCMRRPELMHFDAMQD